jgi:fucose permease
MLFESILQNSVSWRSCLFAVCALSTITSLITAAHHLEEEVRHSEMFNLMQSYFSVGENVEKFFHSKMVQLEYQKQKASVDSFDQHVQTDQFKIHREIYHKLHFICVCEYNSW